MRWDDILQSKRQRQQSTSLVKNDLRSQFEKDYHRIIGSASFRRLQDKTQVFPLDKSDFIRTRLTHSLEVSSFARSLGEDVGARILTEGRDPSFTLERKEDMSAVLQCAGLIHDIGNPPFGHFGEVAIRTWFKEKLETVFYKDRPLGEWLSDQMRADLCHFDGNAQALRLLTKLHYLVDEHGMNLTYALLATIIKYPVSSVEADKDADDIRRKKTGYFKADEPLFNELQASMGLDGSRHPLAYLLEAADDIAYATGDIEDGFKKGFIRYRDLMAELSALEERTAGLYDHGKLATALLEKQYEKGLAEKANDPEEYALQNWLVRIQGYFLEEAGRCFMAHYGAIMDGTYEKELYDGSFAGELISLLKDMGHRYVFDSDFIYKMEISTWHVYDFLLGSYVKAVLYFDTDLADEKMTPVDKKLVHMISDNYKRAYFRQAEGRPEGERLYLRLLLVTDYISGMTDGYATDLFHDLSGIHK